MDDPLHAQQRDACKPPPVGGLPGISVVIGKRFARIGGRCRRFQILVSHTVHEIGGDDCDEYFHACEDTCATTWHLKVKKSSYSSSRAARHAPALVATGTADGHGDGGMDT